MAQNRYIVYTIVIGGGIMPEGAGHVHSTTKEDYDHRDS